MTKIYKAPAKVNLHLAITAVREDGYHMLDTSFVYVDVCDYLHVDLSNDLVVCCSDERLSGKRNLVYQVLSAFQRAFSVQQGLNVFIDKRLPAQAGLGGGSSDAATALWVANRLWNVDCSMDELINFSFPFGADIPCFLFGQASVATGIGEKLIPYLKRIPERPIVVAWPGEGVSTVKAFAHFDKNEFHALTAERTGAKVRARSGVQGFGIGYNDLEKSAVSLCSPLLILLSTMREHSERAWMSGSGSACVAMCDSSEQANDLVQYLQDHALATWIHMGHFIQNHPLQE